MSIAFRTEARTLDLTERAMVSNYARTKNVSEFMIGHINPNDLAISEYITYQVLKNSCNPLENKLADIGNASKKYESQSKKLGELMDICSQATIGLTSLYLEHK